MGVNPEVVPQQTVPVQSGPYQSYGPPFGSYPPQPAMAPPPLPPGVASEFKYYLLFAILFSSTRLPPLLSLGIQLLLSVK